LLPVVGPVAPDLISEVSAEESSYLFGARLLALEESAGSEVVEFATYAELLVGDYLLVWVVL